VVCRKQTARERKARKRNAQSKGPSSGVLVTVGGEVNREGPKKRSLGNGSTAQEKGDKLGGGGEDNRGYPIEEVPGHPEKFRRKRVPR